jgi:hypothetical protein
MSPCLGDDSTKCATTLRYQTISHFQIYFLQAIQNSLVEMVLGMIMVVYAIVLAGIEIY